MKKRKFMALLLVAALCLSSVRGAYAEEINAENEISTETVVQTEDVNTIEAELQGEAEIQAEEEILTETEEQSEEILVERAQNLLDSQAPENDEIKRIMSFNVLTTSKQPISATNEAGTKTRGEMLCEMFDTYAPDSIGLNEVTESWKDYLVNTLVNYEYTNGKTYAIAGLTSNSSAALKSGSAEYSPVIYRSDLYDLKQEGGWWFSNTPDEKSRFEAEGHTPMQFERVFSYAVLCEKGTDNVAYIHISAHYDHQSDDYINMLCAKELKEKADYLKSIYGDVPVVITGDQNADESTNAYKYFADGENGFIDVKFTTDDYNPLSSNAGYGEEYRPELAAGFSIDHIYVSCGNIGVVKHDIIENPYLSDHSAVYAEVEFAELPNITAITADNADIELNAAGRTAYVSTGSDSVTLNITANAAVIYGLDTVDGALTVPVNDGSNDIRLIVTDGIARTVFTVTVYKTSGEAFPVVSEIYPAGGEASFFEIYNAGTASCRLSDYTFCFMGSGLVFDKDKEVKPGETVVVAAGGNTAAINNKFGTNLSDADTVFTSSLSSSKDGVITVKKGETTVSESSYAYLGLAAATDSTVFKFTVVDGEVTGALFPYEAKEGTPGRFEENLGLADKSAFENIDGTLADKFGGEINIETINIGNTKPGSWVFFTNVNFGENIGRAIKVNAAVKGSNAAGKIDIYIDGSYDGSIENAKHIGTVRTSETAPSTWDVYEDFYGNLAEEVTGKHTVTLIFTPDNGKKYVANISGFVFLAEKQQGASEIEIEEPESGIMSEIRVECEWAVNMTAGTKKDGSMGTPNLQNSGKVTTSYSYEGYNILGTTTKGSTATYKNIDFGTLGIKSLKFNLAIKTSNCDGTIRIYEYDNGVRGDEIAYCVIDHTKGIAANYNNYQDVEGVVLKNNITGKHDLLLVFEVTDGYDYVGNMDFFEFGTGVKVYNAFGILEAENAELSKKSGMTSSVTCEACTLGKGMSDYVNSNGYKCIAGCDKGAVVTFKNVDFGNSTTPVESVFFNVDVKNTNTAGHIYIYVTDENGEREMIGYAAVDAATGMAEGAWNNYHIIEGVITKNDITGVHDVVLEFDIVGAKTKYTCKIDYMYFTNTNLHLASDRIEGEEAASLGGSGIVLKEQNYINSKGTLSSFARTAANADSASSTDVNYIAGTQKDTYAIFENIDFGTDGDYEAITMNLALNKAKCGGVVNIYADNASGEFELIGTLEVPNSSAVAEDYNTYREYTGLLSKTDIYGIHKVKLEFITEGKLKYVGNVDYFTFTKKAPEPTPDMSDNATGYIHNAPKFVNAGEDYNVTLQYSPLTPNVKVYLNYNKRTDGGSYKKILMAKNGNIYTATIPGSDITKDGGLTYFFTEEGAVYYKDVVYTNGGESGYAFAMSDFYYIPIRSAETEKTPELLITELNAQDKMSNEREYIVIYNNSDRTLNLADYTMKRYFRTSGYDASSYVFPSVNIEAGKSLVLWKTATNATVEDLNTYYYGSTLTEDEVVKITGSQFPTATGYGLTIFKGSREVCSIMWRYTDTYCTDGNVKFGMPVDNTTVLPIIDNSTDNEAVNFLSVHDGTAVEDAARLLSIADDSVLYDSISLPNVTAYGVNITWTSSNESVLTNEGVLLGGDNTEVALTAVFTRNSASFTKNYIFTCTSGKLAKITYAALIDAAGNTTPVLKENGSLGYILFDRIGDLTDAKAVVTGYRNGSPVGVQEFAVGNDAAKKNCRLDLNVSMVAADYYEIKIVKDSEIVSNVFTAGEYLEGRKINLFVVGDSITQFYKMPDYPRDGWGAELGNYLDSEKVTVRNFGKSGRSTNTYFVEKNFYSMLQEVRPGDYVLIQLATNDCNTDVGIGVTVDHYKTLLDIMMRTIEEKGAFPILVESACTHKCEGEVFIDQPEIRTYNAAAEEVAINRGASFVSLYSTTANLMKSEGYNGMKDIMQYCVANDLRYIEDPYFYTYTLTFGKASTGDKYHYSIYGSNILAKSALSQVKSLGLPISEFVDLSYEPVRLYSRSIQFNGAEVTRASYGAEYEGAVTVTFDFGVATGTVKIDGEEIKSGDVYSYNGSHVLTLYINENNTNTIPFTLIGGIDKPQPEVPEQPEQPENPQPEGQQPIINYPIIGAVDEDTAKETVEKPTEEVIGESSEETVEEIVEETEITNSETPMSDSDADDNESGSKGTNGSHEGIDIDGVEVPEGLPKTGVVSAVLFYGIGAACVAFGGMITVRSRRKEEK